jgi:hypothetical protein
MFGSKVRDRDFFDAFSKHASLCVAGARKLNDLLDSPGQAEKLAREVKQIEHDADTITHETVKRLHETWITPLDRHDIHDLITRLDDVLDMIEAVSERVVIFRVEKKHPLSVQLGKVLLKACELLETAVAGVADVSKSSQKILDAAVEINRLENEADDIYRKALGELLNPAAGAQADLLEIMKWREIFDYLENATDACEDVANVLEAIVLEYA